MDSAARSSPRGGPGARARDGKGHTLHVSRDISDVNPRNDGANARICFARARRAPRRRLAPASVAVGVARGRARAIFCGSQRVSCADAVDGCILMVPRESPVCHTDLHYRYVIDVRSVAAFRKEQISAESQHSGVSPACGAVLCSFFWVFAGAFVHLWGRGGKRSERRGKTPGRSDGSVSRAFCGVWVGGCVFRLLVEPYEPNR